MSKKNSYVDLDMNAQKIENVAAPVNSGDAVNKAYVDANSGSSASTKYVVSQNQSNNLNNTFQDIPEFNIPVEAGKSYQINGSIMSSGNDSASGTHFSIYSLDTAEGGHNCVVFAPYQLVKHSS